MNLESKRPILPREYRGIAPCLKSFVLSHTAWAVFTYALGVTFKLSSF
ncbi:hypothetical protein [Empedobacter brevis]|nr:hypothetical protein [Empedobacter brevis]